MTKQYILSNIGNEEYAFDIMHVLEIIRIPAITRVPNASSHVEGVINLRGNIISVSNMHTLFGIEKVSETNSSRIIILSVDKKVRGVRVDSVNEVCTLESENTESIPNIASTQHNAYIQEIGHLGDRIIGILNANSLLETIG